MEEPGVVPGKVRLVVRASQEVREEQLVQGIVGGGQQTHMSLL